MLVVFDGGLILVPVTPRWPGLGFYFVKAPTRTHLSPIWQKVGFLFADFPGGLAETKRDLTPRRLYARHLELSTNPLVTDHGCRNHSENKR